MMENSLSEELTGILRSKGADIAGFADLHEIEPGIRDNLPSGISIAVALDPAIISGIKDGPNNRYYEEYKRANNLLDSLGHEAAVYLRRKGYTARNAAATDAGINWNTLSTVLPHKTVATRAGLGWIGKCALLVTEEFGSAVRITTVLTDAELPAGEPVNESRCGECSECVAACPGHAISGVNWRAGVPREALYDAFACRETSSEFKKTRPGIDYNICGICIAVCPWTQKYIDRQG